MSGVFVSTGADWYFARLPIVTVLISEFIANSSKSLSIGRPMTSSNREPKTGEQQWITLQTELNIEITTSVEDDI